MANTSRLIQPDWAPEARKLRHFGWILCGVLFLVAYRMTPSWSIASLPAGLGVASLTLATIRPTLLAPVYKSLMFLTIPIGMVVGELIMLLIYFGVFFPISLVFKLVGRDELCLSQRKEQTYWQEKTTVNVDRYYRQF